MTWWQIALLVSVCAFWTMIAVSFGVNLSRQINIQRDVAEAAKWQLPPS